MSTDFTQVKLLLTKDEDVLTQGRRNRVFQNQGVEGKEHYSRQFDGKEFKFYHGKALVVPKKIADHLYRSSGILLGDPISGTMFPLVERVEEWELGETEPSKKVSKTSCPECGEEQHTKAQLLKHLESCGETPDTSDPVINPPSPPGHKTIQVGAKK